MTGVPKINIANMDVDEEKATNPDTGCLSSNSPITNNMIIYGWTTTKKDIPDLSEKDNEIGLPQNITSRLLKESTKSGIPVESLCFILGFLTHNGAVTLSDYRSQCIKMHKKRKASLKQKHKKDSVSPPSEPSITLINKCKQDMFQYRYMQYMEAQMEQKFKYYQAQIHELKHEIIELKYQLLNKNYMSAPPTPPSTYDCKSESGSVTPFDVSPLPVPNYKDCHQYRIFQV